MAQPDAKRPLPAAPRAGVPAWLVTVATIVSAAAFALYARVSWPWLALGWVGLAPWLAAIDRTASLRGALAAGGLMCVAFVLAVFGWLANALQNYTGAPWAIAFIVLLLAAPALQPQFITLAVARSLARGRAAQPWRAALIGACAYVGTEWAWPKLFADTLGHGLYASPLMRQAADIAGAPGLTFVLLLANECVLGTVRALTSRRTRRERLRAALIPAGGVVALVSALLSYGAVRYHHFSTVDAGPARVTAAVVQANISQYARLAAEIGTFDAVRTILDTHFALSAEALQRGPVDLLVWPETVYPTTFGSPKSTDGAAFDREIAGFVGHTGVPLVFGAYDTDGENEFNAAVLLQPGAGGHVSFDAYRKAEPFPLVEQVPALLDSERVRRWLPWMGTWKAGRGPQVLPLTLRDGRTLRIAPLICYDALDPHLAIAAVRQGADLIVTLSNDSWFTFGQVPRLILLISAFRSIETRHPQVRAANTGISAVIDATGDLVDTIDVAQRGVLVGRLIPGPAVTTMMLAWGDWFGPAALVVGLLLLASSWLPWTYTPRGRRRGATARSVMARGRT